jgi:hypothetical protein
MHEDWLTHLHDQLIRRNNKLDKKMQSRQTVDRSPPPHRTASHRTRSQVARIVCGNKAYDREVAEDDQVSTSKASIADAARHGVTSMTHARASVLQCNMVVPPMAELAW